MTYFVLGLECLKTAEVWGLHESKKKAESQASYLEHAKSPLCCQKYIVMTGTEIKKQKITLYA